MKKILFAIGLLFPLMANAQTYLPFKPLGGLSDNTTITTNTTNRISRTISSHFTDVINVKDYGAKCDGSSFDDAPAFKLAITDGLTKGRKVLFGGECHFATPVSVVGHGWIGMDLDGGGGTINVDSGISGINIETDSSTPSADRYRISIHDFTMTTTSSSTNTTGISLKSDLGWSLDSSIEYNIIVRNFSTGFSLTNIGQNRFSNSAFFGSSSSIGYYASGLSSSLSQWANNNVISHVEIVAGICVNYNGALQGDKIFELGCMNSKQGVVVTNGDLAQSFEVHQSYFDVTRSGVNFDGYGLSVIDTSSADIAGGVPDSTYGYTAFSMQKCGGCKLTDNMVFGLGSSTNTPIVAGGSQMLITGNFVHGLDGHLAHCIEVQTPTSLGTPDHIVFANNSCWAAGNFYINGDETRIFGTGNVSSGSGSSSSTANGALRPTQNSYGPIVMRNNDLPTGGSFLRVGNIPSATQGFITANLASTYPNYLVEIEKNSIAQFRVDANGNATMAGSVTSSGFSTAGGSLVLLDSTSKGNYLNYDDAILSNSGGSHLVGVNGKPANLLVEGQLATATGVCLDKTCTNTVALTNGKVTISYNGTATFSIDSSGNVVTKGTITQSSTP